MGFTPVAALPNDAKLVELKWALEIPLRDGVRLNATLYAPRNQKGPLPCVLTLTPYISDSYHDVGVYFAARGLPFLAVDVRGRGNSEGRFAPLSQESRDGYDVVEWISNQAFCNGQVVMWGGSYSGFAQWATAREFPPHLTAIAPAAAPYIGLDFPMRSNIRSPFLVRWLAFTSGRASQGNLFADESFWSAIYRRWHDSGSSLAELDRQAGFPSAVFQEWLKHPEPDAYMDAHNPSAKQYARIQIPVLTITGCYDDDQPGALEHYRLHTRLSSPEARKRHYLIIGPWDHAGTRNPKPAFGGLSFGAASLLDLRKLHFDWYAWIMLGGPKPTFLQESVAFYVMGAEEWRYAQSLEAATQKVETLYLDSEGTANNVHAPGTLTSTGGSGPPDAYAYDPDSAVCPEVDAEENARPDSLVDQSMMLSLSDRMCVYDTPPFEVDREVTGFFRLSAWISLDCPDTDLYASLHEVDASGASLRLSSDAIRARYRVGLRAPKLIDTRDPLLYEFTRFTFVSRLVRRGHRLRLVIAPVGRTVEATFWEKNYNSGNLVAYDTVQSARTVTVKVFHDTKFPSALEIPYG